MTFFIMSPVMNQSLSMRTSHLAKRKYQCRRRWKKGRSCRWVGLLRQTREAGSRSSARLANTCRCRDLKLCRCAFCCPGLRDQRVENRISDQASRFSFLF
ncbi:hypothetical protein ACLK19_13075 [Escherichia coli]